MSAIEIKTTPFSTLISISGSDIPTELFKLVTNASVMLSFLVNASCNLVIFRSFSYNLIPSRSFDGDPEFNTSGIATDLSLTEYTVDGGAGGAELLEWYSSNPGSFYMFLSYDKPQNFISDIYEKLDKYSDVLEVFITDFSYNVIKRGGTNHDLWDISISLEEV